MKLLVVFACSLAMLSGCSAKKNVGANTQMLERRTTDQAEIDKDVETHIKEELRDDEQIRRFSHVNVNVYNGAALLTGEAMNEAIKSQVIEMVRIIKGVRMVHDNLIVDYPSDNLSRANDRRIAQNIRQALRQIHDLPNFDSALIKIVVEQSSVYLMGRVHRDEGTVVINVVRLDPDIRQLVTVFDYID
ncbi:MAG: BON domain-containing protein [Methylococcales bacterium]|nr:BON domain-containing protein [Methylococcales bacterium]